MEHQFNPSNSPPHTHTQIEDVGGRSRVERVKTRDCQLRITVFYAISISTFSDLTTPRATLWHQCTVPAAWHSKYKWESQILYRVLYKFHYE